MQVVSNWTKIPSKARQWVRELTVVSNPFGDNVNVLLVGFEHIVLGDEFPGVGSLSRDDHHSVLPGQEF